MRSRIHISVTNEIDSDRDYQITRRKDSTPSSKGSSKLMTEKPYHESNEQLEHERERTMNRQKSFPVMEIVRNDGIRTESSKALQSYRKNSFAAW